jgi:hypothetical protein
MKTLILSFILAIPFIGFGQISSSSANPINRNVDLYDNLIAIDSGYIKPDTLSAYLLITTKHMGIAYQKRGFVVRRYDREDMFLDCKKQVILPPYNVWSFKIIPTPTNGH